MATQVVEQQPSQTSKEDCWNAFLTALNKVEATADQESADRLPSLCIGWVNPGDVPLVGRLIIFASGNVQIVML